MLVRFLGQGLQPEEDDTCGHHICASIQDPRFQRITIIVAFLRLSGLSKLISFIKAAKERNVEMTFVIGINQYVTSKEALELLINHGVSTYTYYGDNVTFHPKLYLFEGIDLNRIIVGSSNFTSRGLFHNIESSIMVQFTGDDRSGNKLLTEIKDYYEPIIEASDSNIEHVTQSHIDSLYERGIIPSEKFTNGDSTSKEHDDSPPKRKLRIHGTLGNLHFDDYAEGKIDPLRNFEYTEIYLKRWDVLFERMKEYKAIHRTTTVNRNHPDRTLFGWYQKQKRIYHHPTIDMHPEHLIKLKEIGFHFGDGHKLLQQNIALDWVELLEDAIKNGERIALNQKYKYKGRNLGTWLVGLRQHVKQGRKLDVFELVKQLGFDFASHSKEFKDTFERFVTKLENDPNPSSFDYRNIFNARIRDRQNQLSQEDRIRLENAWYLKFKKKMKWSKQHAGRADRVDEWRIYRKKYRVWYPIKIENHQNIELYHWVKRKLSNARSMQRISSKFNAQECGELRDAGFSV